LIWIAVLTIFPGISGIFYFYSVFQIYRINRSKGIRQRILQLVFLNDISIFNLFYFRATKALPCLDGGEILMKQPETKEPKILTVKDEHIFFSLIEERMEQQGFELLDTFTPSVRSMAPAELT
jgi:hypothetical protein